MPDLAPRTDHIDQAPRPPAAGSALEVFAAALRLGLTSFGGPVAHLGYFRDEYVVRRRWLDDATYSELVGLGQFLPGPASSQVGFAVGWLRAGARGAVAAWVAFTLPSALLMLGFALASRDFHGPVANAAIHGLKLAAVAVVARAVLGMARTLTPDFRRRAMAGVAAAAMLLIANPAAQVVVIAAGALAGLILCRPQPVPRQHGFGRGPSRATGGLALALFAVLLVALPAISAIGPPFELASVFYRAGALVFGGGHVVLPLLREGLVPQWMSDAVFLAGYGAAQAVPGPLFSIASYLGATASPTATIGGALAATVALFLPGLLLITGALAFRGGIVDAGPVRRAMAGVNAAVVGILAAAVYDPLWKTAIAGLPDIAIAAVALLLLLRFRTAPIVVVILCVAMSVALTR